MIDRRVKTPCVGICSTGFGDDVCRGCKRFVHEVIDWNHYSDTQKNLVWQRLEHLLQQVMEHSVDFHDVSLFEEQIKSLGVLYPQHFNQHAKAFFFLKAIHKQLDHADQLIDFGISIKASLNHLPLTDLYNQLAEQYWELSKAYYEATAARSFSIEPEVAVEDS